MSELRAVWADAEQAGVHFAQVVRPFCKEQWAAGKRLAVHICDAEDAKTEAQRSYYHGVVLTTIADHAKANGVKFPMAVWKEFFRAKYLGSHRRTYMDPMTKRKVWRTERISTEDLGVRGYSKLIEQVTAFAATELGVTFPAMEDRA